MLYIANRDDDYIKVVNRAIKVPPKHPRMSKKVTKIEAEVAFFFIEYCQKKWWLYKTFFIIGKVFVFWIIFLPSKTNGSKARLSESSKPPSFFFQFYSHIVLIACSDKSLKVFDTNAQKITRDISQCHGKPVTKMVMVRGLVIFVM